MSNWTWCSSLSHVFKIPKAYGFRENTQLSIIYHFATDYVCSKYIARSTMRRLRSLCAPVDRWVIYSGYSWELLALLHSGRLEPDNPDKSSRMPLGMLCVRPIYTLRSSARRHNNFMFVHFT